MAGKWHIHPKWMRWLPAAILFKVYKRKYAVALLYEDEEQTFVLESRNPLFDSARELHERIAYLESVVTEHADLIIAKACQIKESPNVR